MNVSIELNVRVDKIDLPEGIEVNYTNGLRECIICHYWYFLKKNLKVQAKVCDDCHDLMQKAMSFNNAAVVSVQKKQLQNSFLYMSKGEDRNLLGNANLTEKK